MLRATLVCLTLMFSSAFAQDTSLVQVQRANVDNTGILYGDDHAFALTAPKGWVLDNDSGVSDGLYAVFYPKGGSWTGSPAVMYGKGESKDLEHHQTIRQFISNDSSQFMQQYSSARISDEPPLRPGPDSKAIVRKFLYSRADLIAYIDAPKAVIMIVLSANSTQALEQASDSFKELVASYRYMGENQSNKVTDFSVALKKANENLSVSSGEAFDTEVGRSVGSWLSHTLPSCIKDLPDSDLEAFTVLIRVGSSGRAEEVQAHPTTRVSKCLESAFTAAMYPIPPGPSWWVKVNMTFKND